jgi:hypothetical protein
MPVASYGFFPSSPILVTLMMEELSTYETSVLTWATRRNIPANGIFLSPLISSPSRIKSFHFSTPSTPALGSTNLLSNWYLGFLSGAKRQGREPDHSSPTLARLRKRSSSHARPSRLLGIVLSYWSTGTYPTLFACSPSCQWPIVRDAGANLWQNERIQTDR